MIPLADLDRDDVVHLTVHQQVWHPGRQELDWRGGGVAFGNVNRGAAQQIADSALAQLELQRPPQIEHPGHGDHRPKRDPVGADRAIPRRVGTSREPARKVSTGRVSDRDDAVSVDVVAACVVERKSARQGNVLERARPASARIADPPVLDVPGCDSGGGQGRAEMAEMRQVVAIAPEAAVDRDCAGVRPGSIRHPQVSELERLGAVRDAPIR